MKEQMLTESATGVHRISNSGLGERRKAENVFKHSGRYLRREQNVLKEEQKVCRDRK